jgi:hypothetical protein
MHCLIVFPFLLQVISVIKYRMINWTQHAARTKETRILCKLLVGKSQGSNCLVIQYDYGKVDLVLMLKSAVFSEFNTIPIWNSGGYLWRRFWTFGFNNNNNNNNLCEGHKPNAWVYCSTMRSAASNLRIMTQEIQPRWTLYLMSSSKLQCHVA